MVHRVLALLTPALVLCVPAAFAQDHADHAAAPAAQKTTLTPPADVLRSYTGLKTNILKAADTMPADAYTYKPTPDIRTFARVVNHITEAQLHSCAAVNKTTDPAKVPAETAPKAEIVSALKASFAECDKALSALTESNMLETYTVGTATRARISLAWATVSHDNEQYATLALYMRLKGLTPPSSEK